MNPTRSALALTERQIAHLQELIGCGCQSLNHRLYELQAKRFLLIEKLWEESKGQRNPDGTMILNE